jgi:aryl-alcohol dehydrogenase-like predicted oxidoreductase
MSAPSSRRPLGPFRVPPIGLGCMNLSWAYGPPVADAQAERVLLTALDAGVTLFDTATLYGFGANETLVGRVLAPHRDRIVLCSKGGLAGEPVGAGGALQRVIDGRPATLRRQVAESLKRLRVDVIDLYYLHRWDKSVPVEDSVGELARCVDAGMIRSIGLSEVSAATLRRAHAVHPIAAVQSEYSPWTREPEVAVLEACQALGVAFVAFSPVGRGALTGAPPSVEGLDAKDIRRTMPRFSADAWAANQPLLAQFRALAAADGRTPAQLAIAWVLAKAPHTVAIPGTTRIEHLLDDLAAADRPLAPGVVAAVDALLPWGRAIGGRYDPRAQSEVDTETFPYAA